MIHSGNTVRKITRTRALATGLPRYFTGRQCINGHIAERLTRNQTCLECQREYTRRYDISPKGLARRERYLRSPATRDYFYRYHQSIEGQEAQRRYNNSPLGRDRVWRFRYA